MKALWKINNLQITRFIFKLALLEEYKIEAWKLQMEQILCRTGTLSEGEHKKLVVTIV
jgi:hypothetical protein